jgi:hypothetical protein
MKKENRNAASNKSQSKTVKNPDHQESKKRDTKLNEKKKAV